MGLGVILRLGTEHFKSPGRKCEPAEEAGASERSVTGMGSLSIQASRVIALTVHQHGQQLKYSNML